MTNTFMQKEQDIWEFVQENKALLQEYFDVRVRIFKLEMIQTTASIAGILTWLIVSLFMFFLLLFFAGITLGIWLSHLLNSYEGGFGITTLILLFVVIILAIYRKKIFINPVIQVMIKQSLK